MDNSALLDSLCTALPGQAPCGDDLEYDPAFLALDRAAASRAERVVGDSVLAAEEPDWERVRDQALALLQRTRDLRVASHLTTAWTRLHGIDGWADGLALLHGLLDQHWAAVHPLLDAEDNDDATARVNAVLALADPLGALGVLRGVPFVQSPQLGRFSLRDLRIAEGSFKPVGGGEASPSLAEIDACCLECTADALGASAAAVQRAVQQAQAIDALLAERLGVQAPDLKLLLDDLGALHRYLQPRWQARAGLQAPAEAGQVAGAAAAGPALAGSGRVDSPEEVRRRLDEICEYYARCEPSSPVPLLLRRARRLVGCDFLALLRDLAPGGMDELERVTGRGQDD